MPPEAWLRRRTWLSAALAAGVPAALPLVARAQEAESPTAATCSHCKARWQTVEALRSQLPADWAVALEPEPVLGGQMLVLRAGPAAAPPLLLVHGLGQNGFTDWLPVLPALARQWRVLAVDLPGFGYSSTPPARLSPTALARVLDGLLARESRGPAVVAGHSLGGAVALRLADAFPARVSSLVLVDVAGILQRTAFTKHMATLPTQGLPEALKEPAARLGALGHRLVERLFGLPGDPTDLLRNNDWLWPLVLRDRNSTNAALALMDENYSAAVFGLRQPVQVIWGEADAITPLRTGELLARRLPRAQLHTLPGVGHAPMMQAPQDFQALLLRVLQQPPAARVAPLAPPPSNAALPDLHCSGEFDRRYRGGRYREIRIERCNAVHLTDVTAERLVVRDSIGVQLTGVDLRADDVALDAANSELMATACDFSGRMAIVSDSCRLDLAGVRLLARGFALQARGPTRVLASVSEIRDAQYNGWWHEDRLLDRELLNPLDPPRPARPPPGQPPAASSATAAR